MSNGRNTLLVAAALAIVALALFACGPAAQPSPTPEPVPTQVPSSGEFIRGEPMVEGVDVQIMESFPVQAQAVVRGNLPDGCTELDEVTTALEGNVFRIRLTTQRPAGAVCTEALVPFEEVVALDVLGLPAGEYTVDAHGVTASFTLATDNVLPDATP